MLTIERIKNIADKTKISLEKNSITEFEFETVQEDDYCAMQE